MTHRIRFTAVAKFQAARPPLSAIKQHIDAHWNVKGNISLSPNWDGRHVVIFLDSEDDLNAALVCPHRKVQNALFRLFRWTADYNPKKESTLVTKWINLPGLPMEFFTRSCVKAIVSSFAHFLDIDERTYSMNSLQCARACVELDVNNPIPSKIWISAGDLSFHQDIIVEGGVSYCSKCKIHGHDYTSCKKRSTAGPRPATTGPRLTDLPREAQSDKGPIITDDGWKQVTKRKAARGTILPPQNLAPSREIITCDDNDTPITPIPSTVISTQHTSNEAAMGVPLPNPPADNVTHVTHDKTLSSSRNPPVQATLRSQEPEAFSEIIPTDNQGQGPNVEKSNRTIFPKEKHPVALNTLKPSDGTTRQIDTTDITHHATEDSPSLPLRDV